MGPGDQARGKSQELVLVEVPVWMAPGEGPGLGPGKGVVGLPVMAGSEMRPVGGLQGTPVGGSKKWQGKCRREIPEMGVLREQGKNGPFFISKPLAAPKAVIFVRVGANKKGFFGGRFEDGLL